MVFYNRKVAYDRLQDTVLSHSWRHTLSACHLSLVSNELDSIIIGWSLDWAIDHSVRSSGKRASLNWNLVSFSHIQCHSKMKLILKNVSKMSVFHTPIFSFYFFLTIWKRCYGKGRGKPSSGRVTHLKGPATPCGNINAWKCARENAPTHCRWHSRVTDGFLPWCYFECT